MREQNNTRRMLLRQHAGQHVDRAERFERVGRWEEAMAEFKSAVEIDPSMIEAQIALGYHYRRKGLLLKAAEAFRTAVRLSDDYESCFNLGHVLVDLRRYREAEDIFERCLKLKPDDPAASYELAYARYSSEQYDRALALLGELLEKYPDDWELLFLSANCRLRQSDYTQAEATLQRALQGAPDDEARALVLDSLGVAQRQQEFAADAELGIKERLYVDYGAICLGSGADDGLTIPKYERYNLDYADIAVTLRRFRAVNDGLDRPASVILPADAQALPLAIAIAELFDLPIEPLHDLRDDDLPLVVMGVSSGPELYDLILERIPADPIVFALTVDWSGRTEFMTDIVGVFTEQPGTLPWQAEPGWDLWPEQRGGLNAFLKRTALGKTVMAHVTRLLRETKKTLPDTNLADQVDYYVYAHHNLRLGLASE